MKNPVLVDLTKGEKHKLPTNIEHFEAKTNKYSLPNVLKHFIDKYSSERCIVFTNRKIQAAELSDQLKKMGIRSADLHSDISQSRREMILNKFRNGIIKVVCATDVAARGIDIPEIDLILHVDAPQNGIDFYIHRSGRTGRAGRPGKSVVINTEYNSGALDDLKRVLKFKRLEIPVELVKKRIENTDFAADEDDNEQSERSFKQTMFKSNQFNRGDQFKRRFNNRFNSDKNENNFGSGYGQKQRYNSKFGSRHFDE